MKFLLPTIKGCEDIAKKELERLGFRHVETLQGKIIVEGRQNESLIANIIRLNWTPKTVERVAYILNEGKITSLRDLSCLVEEITDHLIDLVPRHASFAVDTIRFGSHNFSSVEANKQLGSDIHNALDKHHKRPKVDLTNPSLIFRFWIENERAFFTVDTTGKNALRKRRYLAYRHPAPMRTTLAAIMLEKLDYDGETLLDPFCGGGTILIEAAHRIRKIPNVAFRDNFAFYNLNVEKGLGNTAHDILLELVEAINYQSANLTGIEIDTKRAAGAMLNAKRAFVSDTIAIRNQDALTADFGNPRLIVSNPPFGVRLEGGIQENDLYQQLAQKIKDISNVDILMIGPKKIFKTAFDDFIVKDYRTISYGAFYIKFAHFYNT